jgi:hypothetical protein
MHFESSLVWEGFGQHILCYSLHTNTCWDALCVHAGMGRFLSKHVDMYYWHGIVLIIRCCDAFFVIGGMNWVWSTHVGLHFMCSPTLVWFGQPMLRHIFVLAGMGWVWSCWDAFLVFGCMIWVLSKQVEIHFFSTQGLDAYYALAGKGWVWSIHVEMQFMFSLLCVRFGQHFSLISVGFRQHKLIYISFARWQERGSVNACW